MATFHRRRPSALREISKNLCKNDESEDLSASPSPSAWIKQVQEHHKYPSFDDEEENTGHQFAFRATNHVHEIIDDHEGSEMESDYVETEVSEEEIRNIQVPYETDVDDSDSQSDYTSVAEQSPLHAASVKLTKHQNRRQSMPNMQRMQLNLNRNENDAEEDLILRSPNAENRPPAIIEQKDIEYDSDHNCGSMNRSLILTQCFDETEPQSDVASVVIKPRVSKKQSILPPKELTFDGMQSPLPPSILRTQKKKKSESVPVVNDTPHFGDIADNLAGINAMLRPSERQRAFGSIDINDDMQPSPLAAAPRKEAEPISLSVEPNSAMQSRKSSYKRKQMTKNMTKCGNSIAVDLDNHMKRLKQILPSPAIAAQPQKTKTINTASDKRRRSTRIARQKKRTEERTQVVESEPEEETDVLEAEHQNEQRPYIDDNDEDDDEMFHAIGLPSTKGKKQKRKQKTGKKNKESKEEVEEEPQTVLFSTRKRKRKRRNVLDISVGSEGSSRRTKRTLRSRKEETLENISSPISDLDEEDDDEYPTFGTPKINRSKRSSKRKKAKRKKRKTPTTKAGVVEDMIHMNVNVDMVEDVEDNIEEVYDDDGDEQINEITFDSPNVNENADEKQELDAIVESDHDVDNHNVDIDSCIQDDDDAAADDDDDISMSSKPQERKVRSHSKEKKKDAKTTKKKRKRNTGKEEASTKKTKKKSTKSKSRKKKKRKKDKKDKKKKKSQKSRNARKRKASETELSELSESDAYEPENKRRRLSTYVVPPKDATQAEETGCRRSKRVRFKPLAYWASERIEYTPTPLTLDKIENTGAKAIIVGQKDQLKQMTKQKTKKPTKRVSKKASKKSSKKASKKSKKARTPSISPEAEIIMSDNEDSDEDNEPFNGNAWIYDPNNDQMNEKCVVKTAKSLNLVPLSFEGDSNSNNNKDADPVSKRVRGAKGLEEEGFSCGVLEIPPDSQKHAEVSYFTEQFFVHRAEKKKLLFKVGDETEFYLSTGSMFFVPPENEYSLHNLSQTVPVKLIFTLIKNNNREQEHEQDEVSR